ncbi:amidohydrolase family protein [Novosphingobium sp. Gsoil 351]|uniref:amidohydrolase family protein n=1 Tax=Novosphingobium sp. Gsoil 351 TaxID=2675225 RepID=UPI0018A807E7|nr:amidohydrolase family protein [Novosphingobium sp. Gsoil 351]
MNHYHHAACTNPRLCCPQHAMLAFGARMAIGETQPAPEGPQPSFREGPDPNLSSFAAGDDRNTRDLFEVAEKERPVVVTGGTVLPMTSAETLPGHDVLIRDGRIEGVQATGGALPDGALSINASGRFVIPGLTNIHQHPPLRHIVGVYANMLGEGVSGEEVTLPYDLMMFQYLAAGITRIQVMAGSPEDLANRENVRSGRYRGPHMRVGSPVIDSPEAIWASAITWYVNDADGGRRAARAIFEQGYDFAKPYTMLGRDGYFGLVEECRALGIEIMGHIPQSVRPEEAFEAGQTGVAHCFEYFLHGRGADRFDPDTIAKRVKLSVNNGVTLQTTLEIARVYEYDCGFIPASEMRFEDTLDPVIRWLMREDSPFLQGWRANPVLMAGGENVLDYSTRICQALYAEGVRLLPGTDMSASSITGEMSSHHEIRSMVERIGMSPFEALRAATVQSAEYQGEGRVAGTIERGKRADLVILDANPLEAIGNTTAIDTVVMGDAILRRGARERGLARLKARYDAMPVPA